MKFPSLTAFAKHLKEAFDLAPIFLVAVPCEFERRKAIEQISSLVLKKDPGTRVVRLSEATLERVKEELFSPGLFGGLTLVIVNPADKMKNLALLLDHFPPHTHLVLGTSSFKPLSDLYQKGKKDVVAIDLSEEKPWDKEKRVLEWLKNQNLPYDVARFLLEHLGPDIGVLDSEVQKLFCYTAGRRVQLSDAEAICGSRDLFTGWQLAEKVVWEKPTFLGDKLSDLSFLFPFIGQLRYQLQLGLRLAESSGKHSIPNVRPQQLEKFSPIAKARKPAFFRRGLEALFQLEFASKSCPLDIGVLFDHFQAKLYAKAHTSS